MKSILREPLFHFVLIGAGLFLGHHFWEKAVTKSDYTIEVSAAEIQRQAAIFASENRRQPTDEDIQGLLFAHVEEQVLMREAERLGLAEDDTIIRRRMAQKMRFMIDETAPPDPPGTAELESWFKDNKDRFTRPAKRSFSHIYVSPTAHENYNDYAADILKRVTDANWKNLGDPFIEQNQYPAMDAPMTARVFGRSFAKSLFALPVKDGWQGPVPSSFGLHIVRIDSAAQSEEPGFEDAKAEVIAAWQEEALRAGNIERLEKLLKKYKVNVEGVDE